MRKILVVFGTRPEAIKMAPLVRELHARTLLETKVCVTAQHRSMLDQVLEIFGIIPDYDLNLMSDSQTLEGLSARILESMSKVLEEYQPDIVLVHGDTTTSSMAALACFYKRIPLGHVEAGLRTGNLWSPWPEEFNRRLTALVAHLHFAPTKTAEENLIAEGVPKHSIEVTGNTVIDALIQISGRLSREEALYSPLLAQFPFLKSDRRTILVTGHRRENFGDGMLQICNGLLLLAERADIQVVYSVHLNPNVKLPVESMLGGKSNIYLIPPQDYLTFVFLMMHSHIILTDSGGIQEEAPSLGKPVLVMREVTERPEAVLAGTAKLVGANFNNIVDSVNDLLDTPGAYESMSCRSNPYGDGAASIRIVEKIEAFLRGTI